MTQPPEPTEPFAQHPRLAELVNALRFQRYQLFLAGLLWFVPEEPPLAITRSEVLGVVPLEVTDGLLDAFRRLADRHERGFMVEHVMELLAAS
jgi:membrane protein required for beta-lactamase induction